MGKIIKKLMKIACVFFMVVGLGLFIGVLAANDWDFKKLSTDEFTTNTYTVDGDFKNVSVKTGSADIKFLRSTDGACKAVCKERAKVNNVVKIENDTLVIGENDTRKWYDHIGLFFESPEITVYLPKSEYGALSVENKTGDIEIAEGFLFSEISIGCSTGDVEMTSVNCGGKIEIKVTTGKAKLTNVTCKSLISNGSTGGVSLISVTAAEKIFVERSTGNVGFERCDAAEITVVTSTGNVTGTLLSDKIFITESSTGKIDVPKTVSGGVCNIKTSTGNIEIKIQAA